jgi:nucleotide-binding universal stress UspA family protein
MIRDIMLAVTHTPGDECALEVAATIAQRADAHLTAVMPVSLPVMVGSSLGAATGIAYVEAFHAGIRAEAAQSAQRLRERLERNGLSCEVRVVETQAVVPQHVLGLHARFADLAVLGAVSDSGMHEPAMHSAFSAMLLDGGRPVLVVPPGTRLDFPVRNAVVAWRPTREATRALHDALALLSPGASVEVLSVEQGPQARSRDGDEPGYDIGAHIARHGFDVRTVVRHRAGEAVATRILGQCQEGTTQLLVAGGYGHSRAREFMLGGTTRRLLRDARVPVLFSH